MPGLNLGIGGGVRFGGAGATIAQAPPATISQIQAGSADGSSSGVAHWQLGVGFACFSTAMLVFLRWTLPG
jgi:hypothetical protein